MERAAGRWVSVTLQSTQPCTIHGRGTEVGETICSWAVSSELFPLCPQSEIIGWRPMRFSSTGFSITSSLPFLTHSQTAAS